MSSSIHYTKITLRDVANPKPTGIQTFADVEFNDGEVFIKSFPIIKTKDGSMFCGLPRVQNKKGEWFPSIKLCDELKKSVTNAVMEMWKEENSGWED